MSTLCKHLVGSVGKTLVGIRGNGERKVLRRQGVCSLRLNGALGHGSTGWQPLGIGERAALTLALNETLVILSYWIYAELVVA